MTKQKQGFAPILILILAVIIAVGVVFLIKIKTISVGKPTATPTASWKTFTSQNFSFMYPSTWSYTPEAPIKGLTNTNYQNLTFKGSGPEELDVQWSAGLSGAEGPGPGYCEVNNHFGWKITLYSIPNLGLNGCTKVVGNNDSTSYILSRKLKNGDTILIDAGPVSSANKPDELINQILSTFKFQ